MARCPCARIGKDWPPIISESTWLQVGGLVENPVDLSLSELKELGMEESVTMHHYIQGWTGIAQWKGCR